MLNPRDTPTTAICNWRCLEVRGPVKAEDVLARVLCDILGLLAHRELGGQLGSETATETDIVNTGPCRLARHHRGAPHVGESRRNI